MHKMLSTGWPLSGEAAPLDIRPAGQAGEQRSNGLSVGSGCRVADSPDDFAIGAVDRRKPVPAHMSDSLHALDARQAVLWLILCGSVIRILCASSVGLGNDESYMVGVSRQIAWSYFDHPPIHVWLVGLWAKLFGEAPVVVRLPFIALFSGSTWLMYRLSARAYGERAGFWAALAFNLAPVFTLSTASWVLPDGPLVFFELLAGLSLQRALFPDADISRAEHATGSPWLFWCSAGAAGGLALLSKYTAIFFFAGTGLYLLTSRANRHWLWRPQPWIGVALGALMFTPVLIWNANHGFVSFAFQGQRGIPAGINLNWFIQDVGGQALYLLPWIALAIAIVVPRAVFSALEQDRLFGWLAAPAIVLFLALGLVTRVLPHWPAAGWVFAFPLLGAWLTRFEYDHRDFLRRATTATAALLLGFFVFVASQANYGWLGRVVPLPKDPTLEFLDWRGLEPALNARGLMAKGTVVAAGHWTSAAKINYALGGQVPVLCLCDQPHHFVYLNDPKHFVSDDAILLARHDDRLAALARRFERVEPLDDIVLTRAGQPAVILKAARGIHLKNPS